MAEKTVEQYHAEKELASRPRRVSELTELERAQLGPAAVRAMQDSEQAQDSIAQKHAAAAAAAAKEKAIVATLPEWISPKAIGWNHLGQRVEVEADHPPLPLSDGRVLLRLTRRKPRPTPGTMGNVGTVAAKLGSDSQTLEPGEARWLAVGGLIRVPPGKSVVVWCLHRPAGASLNDADLSKGFVLDAPRQFGAGYVGEITIAFANSPEPARILQLSPGHYIAVCELVDG